MKNIIITIAVLVIVGAGLVYFSLPEQKEEFTPLSEEPEQQDCGSVANTHLFVSPGSLTSGEKSSLVCINQALLDCVPAKIEFSGENGGNYEIQEKDGQDCVIQESLSEVAVSKSCKIPMDFITSTKGAADATNQSDLLFALTIPFAFSSGQVTNTQTGEVIELDCQ